MYIPPCRKDNGDHQIFPGSLSPYKNVYWTKDKICVYGVEALKTLGKTSLDKYSTKRKNLQIDLGQLEWLCLQEDLDREICPEGSALFPTKSQVPLLEEFRKVTLSDSKIKYMNKKLLYDIFPFLPSLKLDVGSVKEITLPITKKSLSTLLIETKHNLELINVDNSMPPIKGRFEVNMFSTSPRFELKPINVLSNYFMYFILILEAYQVKISMPKIQKNAYIKKFKID